MRANRIHTICILKPTVFIGTIFLIASCSRNSPQTQNNNSSETNKEGTINKQEGSATSLSADEPVNEVKSRRRERKKQIEAIKDRKSEESLIETAISSEKQCDYQVLSREFQEKGDRSFFDLDILVVGEFSEEQVKQLLRDLLRESGFGKRKDVRVLFRVFADKERWKGGNPPIATLMRLAGLAFQEKPEIEINKRLWNAQANSESPRHGLLEEKRKEIFQQIIQGEREAECVGYREFPEVKGATFSTPDAELKYIRDRLERIQELRDVVYRDLSPKWGLLEEQLRDIGLEGVVEKDWPRPPKEPCKSQ